MKIESLQDLLQETLDEEKHADSVLTMLAEAQINDRAKQMSAASH